MKKVTINCEKLNHSNTGLFHYCAHLSRALLATQPVDIELQVYAPAKAARLFQQGTRLLNQYSWHKLFNPNNFTCDLWHATNQDKAYFPKGNAKKVITVHDLNYFNDPGRSAVKKKYFLNNLQKMMERSHHLVCISNYTLDELKTHIQIPIPASVVYNGCNVGRDIAVTMPVTKPAGDFIFTIGTITDKKNFHVLPALLTGNDYKLVIAGDVHRQAYQNKIIDVAKQLGVAGRVNFAGAITEGEKYWYYQNCIAFAFPSLQEGFGLPVVEAMAFGKPLFLSDKTSLPEIGGTDAFYFDSFDPEYMAAIFSEKLKYYELNKPELAAKLIARARTFSWSEAAKQHWKIYSDLLTT